MDGTKHLSKVDRSTVSLWQKKAVMACLKEDIPKLGDLHRDLDQLSLSDSAECLQEPGLRNN